MNMFSRTVLSSIRHSSLKRSSLPSLLRTFQQPKTTSRLFKSLKPFNPQLSFTRPRSTWYQNSHRQSSFSYSTSPYFSLYAIIGANGAIYLLWQYAEQDYRQFRNPSTIRMMMQNFLVNMDNAVSRPWSVVLGNFSHRDTGHLLVNMLALYTFGAAIIDTIGPRRFLGLYMASALTTSVASLAYNYLSPRRHYMHAGSLGASGCVGANAALFACLYPHASLYLFFVLPVPAWIAVGGFFAYDFWRALRFSGGRVDVAGHVGM
ncbi:hypothetical protein BKA69DRAFT_1062223 [Paraphysoderma sedebokerense]|nr:hypothetical protein BKA69DRAFT_1062223 [Paraphysoderma sedebokerense]